MLTENRGEIRAADLAERMRTRYEKLYISHMDIRTRSLRSQLKNVILPGVALYQTLLEDLKNDRAVALAETETLLCAVLFKCERQLIPLLNLVPDPFPILRPALRQMTKNTYLPGASEVVEDSINCFAINIYRCFIFDTLTKAGAAELTPVFCKTDDWLAELLPKVHWLRTGTLANGADLCDFRWCKCQ